MRRLAVGIFGFFAAALLAPSCLSPTQITLDLRTDVDCSSVQGTAVSAAAPGSVERGAPKLTTRRCESTGSIGTLVVSPESGTDARVAIRIVTGVSVPVE